MEKKKFKEGDTVIFKYGYLFCSRTKRSDLEDAVYLGYDKKNEMYWYDTQISNKGKKGTIMGVPFMSTQGPVYAVRREDGHQFNHFEKELKSIKDEK